MPSNVWSAVCLTALLAASASAQDVCGKSDKALAPSGNGTNQATVSTVTRPISGSAAACPALPATHPTLLWTATEKPAHRLVASGLPNFGELNEHVWRSGQPNRLGYQQLVQMHVKTIVNLRSEFPQEKDQVPNGVNYMQIPITDETAPTEEQANQFLHIVANPNNWPILVHCRMGEGRTGVMCALVRYAIDGWNDKLIQKEICNFHITHFGLVKARMCDGQRRFLQQWEAHNEPGVSSAWIGATSPTAAAENDDAHAPVSASQLQKTGA